MEWDQILPLAIFITLTVVLILFMRRRINADARRPELARLLCSELGFDFITGNEARFRNSGPRAVPLDLTALNQLPSSLKASLLEDSSWRGEGFFGAVRVAVYDDVRPTGSHFQTFLVVRAYFPEPLKESFNIEKKGVFSFPPPGRFRTGNAFFDTKLRFTGNRDGTAVRYLSLDKFLRAAEALFVSSRRARIDENGASWEKKEAPIEIVSLKSALLLVSNTVLAFS